MLFADDTNLFHSHNVKELFRTTTNDKLSRRPPAPTPVGDTVKAIKIMRGSLDAAFELTKVIKCSMFLKS